MLPYCKDISIQEISIFQGVLFVLCSREGNTVYTAAMRRQPITIPVLGLDLLDKASVVRSTLSTYRKQLDESHFNNQV